MNNSLRLIYAISLIFLLLVPIQVSADGESNDGHGGENAPWLAGQGNDDHDDGHDHVPSGSPWLNGEDDGGHGDDHGDHDREYEEPGANLPLLSTFAAINGGFILFGAVRKYHKKREYKK